MSITAVAVCAPQQALAFTVTATITGKVNGLDNTGVFGAKGPLNDQDFMAVFHIDPAKGTPYPNPPQPQNCYNGLQNVGSNAPVTKVTLTIHGVSHTFSPENASTISSLGFAHHAGSPKTTLHFSFYETFVGEPNNDGSDYIGTELGLNKIDVCRNWDDVFPPGGGTYKLQPGDVGTGRFEISNKDPSQQASGRFSFTSVSVALAP